MSSTLIIRNKKSLYLCVCMYIRRCVCVCIIVDINFSTAGGCELKLGFISVTEIAMKLKQNQNVPRKQIKVT